MYEETGIWTYDDATKTLTVVTEYESEYDQQTYTDIFKAKIELVNDQLVISGQEDGDSYEIILKRKS